MPPRGPGRPRSLTLERIADAVVAIGLAEFSVRALAERLGVTEKTLYGYARGRDELIAIGMDKLLRESGTLDVSWMPGTPWPALLRRAGHDALAVMLLVPVVGERIAEGLHSRAEGEYANAAGTVLLGQGIDADTAMLALAMVFDAAASAFRSTTTASTSDSAGERASGNMPARLAPNADAPAESHELYAATRRAVRLTAHERLDV